MKCSFGNTGWVDKGPQGQGACCKFHAGEGSRGKIGRPSAAHGGSNERGGLKFVCEERGGNSFSTMATQDNWGWRAKKTSSKRAHGYGRIQ